MNVFHEGCQRSLLLRIAVLEGAVDVDWSAMEVLGLSAGGSGDAETEMATRPADISCKKRILTVVGSCNERVGRCSGRLEVLLKSGRGFQSWCSVSRLKIR